MNKDTKEILEKIAKGQYDAEVIHDVNILGLLEYINNLERYVDETFLYTFEEIQDKLIEKQQIIAKAIDYLEQEPVIKVNGKFINIYSEDDNKLLSILRGEDNE